MVQFLYVSLQGGEEVRPTQSRHVSLLPCLANSLYVPVGQHSQLVRAVLLKVPAGHSSHAERAE